MQELYLTLKNTPILRCKKTEYWLWKNGKASGWATTLAFIETKDISKNVWYISENQSETDFETVMGIEVRIIWLEFFFLPTLCKWWRAWNRWPSTLFGFPSLAPCSSPVLVLHVSRMADADAALMPAFLYTQGDGILTLLSNSHTFSSYSVLGEWQKRSTEELTSELGWWAMCQWKGIWWHQQ